MLGRSWQVLRFLYKGAVPCCVFLIHNQVYVHMQEMHTHTSTCTHVCTYICTYVCMYVPNTYVCTCIHAHMHSCSTTHSHVHVCNKHMHTYVNTYNTHSHVHMYLRTFVRTYIHTCTYYVHMYTHAHIHTYSLAMHSLITYSYVRTYVSAPK